MSDDRPANDDNFDQNATPPDSTPQALDEQSIFGLAKLLATACICRVVAAIPLRIRQRIVTGLGMIGLFSPLALLLAPTTTIWLSIIGVTLAAIVLITLLVAFAPEDYY